VQRVRMFAVCLSMVSKQHKNFDCLVMFSQSVSLFMDRKRKRTHNEIEIKKNYCMFGNNAISAMCVVQGRAR
jgi:hypothetical protein